jgi:Listeria-Bacteroides repeat domain (List_Bact_rpt).
MKSKRRLMVLALSVLICLVVAMTLTACQQFCTVTFKEEGISSQTVFKGGKATEPLTVRQGMRVVWYTDEALTCVFDFDDVIEKDVTLYPKWISTAPETIKVTFKNNGNVIGTLSVVKGEKFNPVFLSANNKTLEGWQIEGESELFDFETGAWQDVTLVAVWSDTRELVSVTFKCDDDEMNLEVGSGGKVVAPWVAEKEGYEFKGWYASDSEQPFDFENSIVETDLVLNARFEEKSYTVTFLDRDGDELQKVTVKHGGNALVLADVPDHDEPYFYSFDGWECESDLTEVVGDAVATASYDANYLPEEMLAFDLRHDGTYAVRLKDKTERDYSHYNIAEYCVLPETYNGKPVTMVQNRGFMPEYAFVFDGEIHLLVPHTYKIVGGQAFEHFNGVEIVLAEGVREIWNRAFGDQTYKNVKLVLPSSLTLIEYWSITFGHFQIELADGAKYISDEKGIWTADRKELCYIHNRDLISDFTVPEGTDYIAPAVFAYTGLENVTVEGALTGIGGDNFLDSSLQSIVFMDTVERVESGEDTDYNLNYWIEDDIERHLLGQAFWYSASFQQLSIENFVLPNGLKHIGQGCFSNANVVEINLDGIEHIGRGAFAYVMEGVPVLKSVSVTNSDKYYSHEGVSLVARGAGAQGGDMLMMYATANQTVTEYAIPSSVTTIDSFSMTVKYLTKLTVNEGCLEILGRAIDFVPQVPGQPGPAATVELPSSLKKITDVLPMDYWGYNDVSSTTEPAIALWHGRLVFAKDFKVEEINPRAISVLKQYSEESFVIPASVTKFGDGFGANNYLVKNFEVEQGNESFVAFGGWLYKKLSPTKLRLVAVPRLTEQIVDGKLVFPETDGYTLTEIGDYVFSSFTTNEFRGVSGIKDVEIPQGVESVGIMAFSNCNELRCVELPESLRELKTGAFQYCRALEKVVFKNDLTPILGGVFKTEKGYLTGSVFYDYYGYYDEELDSFIEIEGLPENCKIYVPDQSFGAYRTSFGKHAMQEDGVDTYSDKIFRLSEMSAA